MLYTVLNICSSIGTIPTNKILSSRFYAMEVANLRKELKEKDNIIHNLLLKLQEIEKNSKKNQISSFFPKVSIVIPVFNKLNFTRRCIELLIRNTNSGLYEIVIVDNGSSDEPQHIYILCRLNLKLFTTMLI